MEELQCKKTELEQQLVDISEEEGSGRNIRAPNPKRRCVDKEKERADDPPIYAPVRYSSEEAPTHPRYGPKIRDLPIYKGKSIRKAQTFIAEAECRFCKDKRYYFSTDTEKIDYCIFAFDTKPECI